MADVVERDLKYKWLDPILINLQNTPIKLHEMLKAREHEGLEGWQQSKITKAPTTSNQYIML